jgi:zinc D-Ala-D-Ala carboxypeptidase
MKISEHFHLSEFEKSSTAERLGIDNTAPAQVVANLTDLVVDVLEPLRRMVKRPIVINSGYRSLELNRTLKSKDTSQHVQGQAADIECPGLSNKELASVIRDNLPYDQLILEFYNKDDPSAGWVHVSHKRDWNRFEVLSINRHGVQRGLA